MLIGKLNYTHMRQVGLIIFNYWNEDKKRGNCGTTSKPVLEWGWVVFEKSDE